MLDEDVATPTNGNSWTSDEELTPLFSSNFPSTQDPNALRREDHSMMESASIPIEPDMAYGRS